MKLLSLLFVLGSLFAISVVEAKAIKVADPVAAMKALYAKLEKDDYTKVTRCR